jgi:hypothetical protein
LVREFAGGALVAVLAGVVLVAGVAGACALLTGFWADAGEDVCAKLSAQTRTTAKATVISFFISLSFSTFLGCSSSP